MAWAAARYHSLWQKAARPIGASRRAWRKGSGAVTACGRENTPRQEGGGTSPAWWPIHRRCGSKTATCDKCVIASLTISKHPSLMVMISSLRASINATALPCDWRVKRAAIKTSQAIISLHLKLNKPTSVRIDSPGMGDLSVKTVAQKNALAIAMMARGGGLLTQTFGIPRLRHGGVGVALAGGVKHGLWRQAGCCNVVAVNWWPGRAVRRVGVGPRNGWRSVNVA